MRSCIHSLPLTPSRTMLGAACENECRERSQTRLHAKVCQTSCAANRRVKEVYLVFHALCWKITTMWRSVFLVLSLFGNKCPSRECPCPFCVISIQSPFTILNRCFNPLAGRGHSLTGDCYCLREPGTEPGSTSRTVKQFSRAATNIHASDVRTGPILLQPALFIEEVETRVVRPKWHRLTSSWSLPSMWRQVFCRE